MCASLGERLKKLIHETGLEQQEVARSLGIKPPTFNGYVSNKREPSIARLKQFAQYFCVSIDYLVGYSEIKNPYSDNLPEEPKPPMYNPDSKVILELAGKLKANTLKKTIPERYSKNKN